MRRFSSFVIVALTACINPPPPTQLAPKTLTSPRSVMETTQAATRSLVADGFDITLSDATGGIVNGKRVRAGKNTGDYVRCRWPHGSIAEANGETALTVTVTSKAATSGSSVYISSLVHSSMPGLQGSIMAQPASETDCASTGLAEGHVADAIATP